MFGFLIGGEVNDYAVQLKTLENNMELATLFVEIIIGIALICVACGSNKIAKNQLNAARRDIYLSVYDNITKALGHVFAEGNVNDDAKDLFWQARDRARLELPDDIQQYTQNLFDKMWEAYILYYNKISGEYRLPKGKEKSAAVEEHQRIIGELIKERPHDIFSKHMKIKIR
ncbi:MAG: hypothetical protein CO093_01050 [Alphaproteobacteria bacterium CG_4_9_14_3_um_filter_47_13]|nr:MAG: hypothetical protein CO093_01050 [Alphaproteobacteria bacterium CG_4_9_14_3_um_filter_47_13]